MSILLFRLAGVPEDEADDVRELLNNNDIDYYETEAGRWGVSLPALWLSSEDQEELARQLLHSYQQSRSQKAHEDLEKQILEGNNTTLYRKIVEDPFRILGYIAVILLVLMFSLKPFIGWLE